MASFFIYQNSSRYEVLVDDSDLTWVPLYEWKVSGQNYVYRNDPDRGYVRLHREILGVRDKKVYVDHRNGNRLDNRRDNLRAATPQQNAANNSSKSCYAGKARVSSYKGVTFRRGKWRMNIKLPDGRKVDRLFPTEEAAARAYDGLALHFYGAFARKNFPDSVADEKAGKELER